MHCIVWQDKRALYGNTKIALLLTYVCSSEKKSHKQWMQNATIATHIKYILLMWSIYLWKWNEQMLVKM